VDVGINYYGACNVSGWAGIVQVAAGYGHTVGLKADGSVVAKGNNNYTNGRSQYRFLPFVLPHMAILYKIELTPISIGV